MYSGNSFKGIVMHGLFERGNLPADVSSGQITSGDVGNNSVTSGSIANGQIFTFHVASGGFLSGAIGSGQIGTSHVASGGLGSGAIGSGQIGTRHIASGGLQSGAVGSGLLIPSISVLVKDGGLIAGENISGLRAVFVNRSGDLQVAMASLSGRMPAIGVVIDNVLSGAVTQVFSHGFFQAASGLADYSGMIGDTLWVGRSGHVVQWSGAFNSGGLSVTTSGSDFIQRLGVIVNSGGGLLNVSPILQRNLIIQIGNGIQDTSVQGLGD